MSIFRKAGSTRKLEEASPGGGVDEQVDNMEECPLVRRLPQIAESGDWAVDAKRSNERDAFKELLTILWNHPNRIQNTLGFAKKLGARVKSDDAWKKSPEQFGKVDKEWIVWWFGTWKPAAFDGQVLDNMECDDTTFIHKLFCMVLQIPLTMAVPAPLQESRQAMKKFCDDRLATTKRGPEVLKAVNAHKKYDFKTGAVYKLIFKGNKCVQVTHISGDSVSAPEHVVMTKDFKMIDWNSDMGCRMELPPSKFFLKDLFANAGPHKSVLTKPQLAALATAAAESFKKAAPPKVDTKVLTKAKEAKSQRMAEMARATLAKHREEKRNKSMVDFTT